MPEDVKTIRAVADRREIRVFISSTFRDMQEEREELVKQVFPQLRKLCEQRGVVWSDVDLRWGVTDEQKAEGHALPICLGEIERCWPYFIGLLGERYGPPAVEIHADALARAEFEAEHVHEVHAPVHPRDAEPLGVGPAIHFVAVALVGAAHLASEKTMTHTAITPASRRALIVLSPSTERNGTPTLDFDARHEASHEPGQILASPNRVRQAKNNAK